ncbi:NUDIX hydrolase [Candidatus Bipolaricaulota bacterium]|nr:NUDIX hydrolase [Candidatus Bipolaricaulota bacterium]
MIPGDEENLEEKTLKESLAFSGDLLSLTLNTVRTPSGKRAKREVVHHPGGVVIIPLITEGQGDEVLLVKQYREPAGQPLWELPAGTLEEGETQEECARRELIEETNHRPNTLEKKVDFFTSPGYTDEILTLYLATGLEKLGPSEEVESPEDENLIVESFSTEELIEMASKGKITDGKTLAGLFFLTH